MEICITKSQYATWVLRHSRYSEVTCVMNLLNNVSHIGNEQNADLNDGRIVKRF